MFFEQHLFYSLATTDKKKVACLFKDIFDDRGYTFMGNIHEAPYMRDYIHLLGHCKRDISTCVNMARKLRMLYPDVYYNIIKQFKDRGLDLYTSAYNHIDASTIQEYETFDREAITLYQNKKEENGTDEKKHFYLDSCNNIETSLFTGIVDNERDCNIKTMREDLAEFIKQTKVYCTTIDSISPVYLHGACLSCDDEVDYFYKGLDNIQNMVVYTNPYTSIIHSSYNWAGIYNMKYKAGVEYYENLNPTIKGTFNNLLVPDINGMILYDIDELETALLNYAKKKTNILDIFKRMEELFDEEVISQYYEQYKRYIENMLSSLIVKRALRVDMNASRNGEQQATDRKQDRVAVGEGTQVVG